MTQYTILLPELITRQIIREDQIHEWMNKLTDDELIQRDQEIYAMMEESGVSKTYPEWNTIYMSMLIDTDVYYNIFKKNWAL